MYKKQLFTTIKISHCRLNVSTGSQYRLQHLIGVIIIRCSRSSWRGRSFFGTFSTLAKWEASKRRAFFGTRETFATFTKSEACERGAFFGSRGIFSSLAEWEASEGRAFFSSRQSFTALTKRE